MTLAIPAYERVEHENGRRMESAMILTDSVMVFFTAQRPVLLILLEVQRGKGRNCLSPLSALYNYKYNIRTH